MFSIRLRQPFGNFYQVTADVSYSGNITSAQIISILTPILTNPPPQFNITYVDNGSLDPEEILSLNRKWEWLVTMVFIDASVYF